MHALGCNKSTDIAEPLTTPDAQQINDQWSFSITPRHGRDKRNELCKHTKNYKLKNLGLRDIREHGYNWQKGHSMPNAYKQVSAEPVDIFKKF